MTAKPKYQYSLADLEIRVKEWYDRPNGNSYFGGKVYAYSNGQMQVLTIPFQYGYGQQWQVAAHEVLTAAGYAVGTYSEFLCTWIHFKGTPARQKAVCTFEEGCKKRDVQNFAKVGV